MIFINWVYFNNRLQLDPLPFQGFDWTPPLPWKKGVNPVNHRPHPRKMRGSVHAYLQNL